MAKQVTFVPRITSLIEIAAYHADTDASHRLFHSEEYNPNFIIRFAGERPETVNAYLLKRLEETDLRSSLAILGQLEAAFQIDYKLRCEKRKRDALSQACLAIKRANIALRQRVNLEDQILKIWREHYPELADLTSQLKSALKFRHWLAHGMYWEPNLGRRYDYQTVYVLADGIFASFPLLR